MRQLTYEEAGRYAWREVPDPQLTAPEQALAEVGGREGAHAIAAALKARGAHFEFALDEGGAVMQGVIAGVEAPVANIMLAEKGYASFELVTHDDGGHSSRPPPQRQRSLARRGR